MIQTQMMKTKISFLLPLVAVLALMTAVVPSPAFAQTAEELRRSGAAGEQFDGFMVARDSSAQSAVDSINSRRRTLYEARARELGVSLEEVGQIYAKEIVDNAAPGTWFLPQSGDWQRK